MVVSSVMEQQQLDSASAYHNYVLVQKMIFSWATGS